MKPVSLTKCDRSDIESVSLLTYEDFQKYVYTFPPVFQRWWLRSFIPDAMSDGSYVGTISDTEYSTIGYLYNYEEWRVDTENGLRPVFRLKDVPAQKSEKIIIGDILCTVIDDNYALSDRIIESRQFDSSSSNWNASNLKEFLESEDFFHFIGLDS